MQLNLDTLTPNQTYHVLMQTIIPRPIAWVLSENEDKSLNLAPFSYFNAMCSDPALFVMSIGKKAPDVRKDTALNLLSGREFIVHIASTSDAEALTKTAATLDYEASEVEHAQLKLTEFPGGELPRLANCNIAYRCSLYDHHLVGPGQQAFIYAQAHSVYLSDSVASETDGRVKVSAQKVDPLARLGANEFSGITDTFKVTRPK